VPRQERTELTIDTALVRDDGRAVAELLTATRALVGPVIESVIAQMPGGLRLIVGYHFGLWDKSGARTAADSGKAIRPALVLASARLAGGEPRDAVRAAAAVELVHNFTLLHDDVMDRDLVRRNRPTVWAEFGVPDAILAGDLLQAVAFRLLAESGPAAAAAVGRLVACMVDLCEGQHQDCAFERRFDVGLDECAAMSEAKTGALLGCCCALGALAAGADQQTAERLDRWGRCIGRAFQLVDDVLGIWGDPARTGKPAYSDLAARKKSLPVVAALNSGTDAGLALAGIYRGTAPLSAAEQLRAADLVELAGARRWADDQIGLLLEQARQLLVPVGGAAGGAQELLLLGALIAKRDK
jgi:geranylgeranyl diphosphate synthase type I